MKIQPQSGLGDLIFALPLIDYLIQRGEAVTVATNHAFLLDMYAHTDLIHWEPVEINYGNPVVKREFTHLKYTRYKDHYFQSYFYRGERKPLEDTAYMVGSNLYGFAKMQSPIKFDVSDAVLYAPPRATARDKAKKIFPRAPDPKYAESRASASGARVIVIGQNELFAPGVNVAHHESLLDKLNFWELVQVVWSAKAVVSQVSMITALAGALRKPTDFLPAKGESISQHAKHVSGVVWPNQEVI